MTDLRGWGWYCAKFRPTYVSSYQTKNNWVIRFSKRVVTDAKTRVNHTAFSESLTLTWKQMVIQKFRPVLYDSLVTVKAAPNECVIRTGQP